MAANPLHIHNAHKEQNEGSQGHLAKECYGASNLTKAENAKHGSGDHKHDGGPDKSRDGA
jgi:hypothetical protein